MNNTASTDDEGFGLVEAVVSMLILAALAIAFLPVLITGLKQSTTNSAMAFATQLVGERMSLAQTATSCSALTLVASSGRSTDPSGREIDVTTTVQDCSAGRGTYSVTATARLVVDGMLGDQLATASTLVYLP